MFSSDKWFGASADFYPENIDQSLRFEDGDSPYLYRDPGSAGNSKTFTYSCWFKICNLASQRNLHQPLFSAGPNSSNFTLLYIDRSSDDLRWYWYNGSTDYGKAYDIKLRDTTNWYHLVWAFDTTQSTASNRAKVYVNGTQITDVATDYGWMGQNQDMYINSTDRQYVGKYVTNSHYLDGYLAEVNLIDGQQLEPNSFGELKNGVWVPKSVSGLTYGTNGFRLTFADSSSLGDDTSSNGNDYTSSGLASTDVVLDSPTNNFCTLNPLNANDNRGEASFSEGNLRITSTSALRGFSTGTFKLTGKHYFEVYYNSDNSGFIGINDINNNAGGNSSGQSIHILDGTVRIDGSASSSVTSLSSGDVIGVEVDIDAKTIEFFKNGVSVSDNTYTTDAEYFPFIYDSSGGREMDLIANFGQDASFAGNKTSGSDDATDSNGQGIFYETPSNGFLALCSSNLPDTTISPNQSTQADDHFNTVLYTGDASSDRSLTGFGFQPDWVWQKTRSASHDHFAMDSSRGANAYLKISLASTEASQTNFLKSFDSDGVTIGDAGVINGDGVTNVMWNWKANGGTTSSNTDGTITSTVQANTTAGFSIVLYSGDSSSFTVGHGLNSAPEWVIVKSRTHSERWAVFHTSISNQYIYLNENFAGSTGNADERFGNSTSVVVPNSTVVTLGANNSDVSKNGEDYVMYCFHSVEGYSKFGSYTGNSSSDGTFVYTGFRPAFIMVKKFSGADNWLIHDNARDPDNVVQKYLLADSANTEASDNSVDFLSNGFKWRLNSGARNTSGQTYIYMAFSDGQTAKFSNAR